MRNVRFSERHGYKPVKAAIQVEAMDRELTNRLWNCVYVTYLGRVADDVVDGVARLGSLFRRLWHAHLKRPVDKMHTIGHLFSRDVRDYFFSCKWYEVYDLMEFLARNDEQSSRVDVFTSCCNEVLEEEVSGYRFVGTQIAPITSNEEIEAVEVAMTEERIPAGARAHLDSALEKLSDRENLDYRNSVKESISAVESLCKHVTRAPRATLSDALKEIKRAHGMHVHGALNAAFDKLYGYTSDEEGVRHAMMDDPHVSFAEAKFMLVACSAFVNYVVAKLADAATLPTAGASG